MMAGSRKCVILLWPQHLEISSDGPGLSTRIMMFQQEVTILSHTTLSKAVISPLLPLNSCAVVIENAFCGMKIK